MNNPTIYPNLNTHQERIFPFFRGEYMGTEKIGFSDIKSAKKYMKMIPRQIIYDECFGGEEQFKRDYGYLCAVNRKLIYNKGFAKPDQNRTKCVIHDCDYQQKTYIRDLEPELRESILNDLKNVVLLGKPDELIPAIEFEEKYNLFPHIYCDDSIYKKAYSNFVKDNVEFKQGMLHSIVELY